MRFSHRWITTSVSTAVRILSPITASSLAPSFYLHLASQSAVKHTVSCSTSSSIFLLALCVIGIDFEHFSSCTEGQIHQYLIWSINTYQHSNTWIQKACTHAEHRTNQGTKYICQVEMQFSCLYKTHKHSSCVFTGQGVLTSLICYKLRSAAVFIHFK